MEPSKKKLKCPNKACKLTCISESGFQAHLRRNRACQLAMDMENSVTSESNDSDNGMDFNNEDINDTTSTNFYPLWSHQKVDDHLSSFYILEEQQEFNKIETTIQNYATTEKLLNADFFEHSTDDNNDVDESDDNEDDITNNNQYLQNHLGVEGNYDKNIIDPIYSKYQFLDNYSESTSNEETFCIELLKILQEAQTPNYVYNDIMKIIHMYLSGRTINMPSNFFTRNSVIQHFVKRYNFEPLKPTMSQITYKNKNFPIVKYNAEAMIMSLLQDTTNLFNDENLLFPTVDGTPTGPIKNELNYIGDLETAKAYQNGCIKLKKNLMIYQLD